jgi:hypothetical protein
MLVSQERAVDSHKACHQLDLLVSVFGGGSHARVGARESASNNIKELTEFRVVQLGSVGSDVGSEKADLISSSIFSWSRHGCRLD